MTTATTTSMLSWLRPSHQPDAMPQCAHPAEAFARRRVLVADDEPILTRSLTRVLTAMGYDVVAANDGLSALALLRQQEFDVVLSDIQMPGLSGMDLIRSAREHGMDVPIILMTADPTVETAAQAVELGALQYLVKPIPMETLFRSMERASKLHLISKMKRDATRLLGQLEITANDNSSLSASFDRALDSLWIAFQPIVSGGNQGVFGYEALLRCTEKTLPNPGAVLSAAEELQRLPELGRKIRSLIAKSVETMGENAIIFVNLHSKDLLDPELISPHAPLSKIAHQVVLEITERAALDDIKDIRSRIAALRAMGFRIAIDDLGAGYAGLTSFALLEPEFVKFDMSLVRSVNASPIRQKLIGSMSSICREMGIQVVAEGIETVEERDTVLELGCNLLQGYLFARPSREFTIPNWP